MTDTVELKREKGKGLNFLSLVIIEEFLNYPSILL